MRRLILASLAALVLGTGAVPADPAPQAGYTLEEARLLGLAAIESGRPDVAAQIARALLQGDPEDSFAHFLLARAALDAGALPEAGAAARLAFRYADTPVQRQQSARLVALAAWNQRHLNAAQRWLRRATVAAPPEARAATLREFTAVRAANPLDLTLQFSATPSDNVNNGAASQYNIIDGVPVVGWLSADGQALSGVTTAMRAGATYRLPGSAEGRNTWLGARLDLRRVDLSSEARAAAPDLDPRAYDSARAEVSVRHVIRLPGRPWELSGDIGAGLQTEAGEFDYRFLRAGTTYLRGFDERTAGSLALAVERRGTVEGQDAPVFATSLSLGVKRSLPGADVLSLSAFASHLDTPVSGRSSTTVGAEIAWDRGRKIGPALLSMRLSYAETQFPDYRVGVILVPGGRQDRAVTAAADLTFPGVSVQGFSPRITFTHSNTTSNVSRFETRRTGVLFGLTASF